MSHILVLPDELRVKLNAAHADTATQAKWLDIGVNTVDEMIDRIVSDLNSSYLVLSITTTREENTSDIKERIKTLCKNQIFSLLDTRVINNRDEYLSATRYAGYKRSRLKFHKIF